MSRMLLLILSFLLVCLNAGLAGAEDADLAASGVKPDTYYQLRPGDALQLSVWREEGLQSKVMVLPDGSITLPLVGRVEVAGLSTPEVEKIIATRLKEYIPEPIVTVTISGIEGNRAYVLGKVTRPGSFIINGSITVLQAISIVGGFDKFADENSVKLIRAKADTQEIFPVNYRDIISGKDMSTNIRLKGGDTIVVQ